VSEPRIVPPEEARDALGGVRPYGLTYRDLVHTAAVLGEQREAALHRHEGEHWCTGEVGPEFWRLPCPTARALGVTG
jgi:hypothetical protein